MGLSLWHLLLILIVVFIFFGAGRLPSVMGDVGKGIRSLRDGLKGHDGDSKQAADNDTKQVDQKENQNS